MSFMNMQFDLPWQIETFHSCPQLGPWFLSPGDRRFTRKIYIRKLSLKSPNCSTTCIGMEPLWSFLNHFFFFCACSFFVERWWRVMCDSLVKRCLWAFCVTLRCKKAFHKTCFRRARGLILFGTGDMRLANGHDIPDSSQSILRV